MANETTSTTTTAIADIGRIDDNDELLRAKLHALEIAATRGRKRRAAKRALHNGHGDSDSDSDKFNDGISILDGEDAASVRQAGASRGGIRLAIRKRGRRSQRGRSNAQDGDDDDGIERHDFAEDDEAAALPANANAQDLVDVNSKAEGPSPAGSYLELPTMAGSRPGSTTTELEDSDLEPSTINGLALPSVDNATASRPVKRNSLAPPPFHRSASSASSSSSSSGPSSVFQTPGEADLQSPFSSDLIAGQTEADPFEQQPSTSISTEPDHKEKPSGRPKRSDTLRSIDIDGPSSSSTSARKGKRPERGSSLRIPASIPFIGSDEPTVGRSGTHLSYKKPKARRRSGSNMAPRGIVESTDDDEEEAEQVDIVARQDQNVQGGSEAPSSKTRSRGSSIAAAAVPPETGVGSFIRRTATLTRRKLPQRSATLNGTEAAVSEAAGAGVQQEQQHPHSKARHRRRKRRAPKSHTEQLKEAAGQIVDSMHAAGYEHDELILKEDRFTEVLYENQRGIYFLGSRYGSGALLPGDPAKWAKIDAHTGEYVPSPYDTSNHPLPTPAWRWHHQEWLVNMAGDVDSEGFSYSTRFGSKFWRGVPSFRFVVRRRMWIRTRYRPTIDPHSFTKLAKPSHLTVTAQKISDPDATAGERDHFSTLAQDEILGGTPSAAPDGSEELPRESERSSSSGREELQNLLRQNPVTISNPFASWYNHTKDKRTGKKRRDFAFFKEDLVHANFGRVARALSRSTQLDRERLAWFEYWLGVRGEDEKPEIVGCKYADSGDDGSDDEEEKEEGGAIGKERSRRNGSVAAAPKPDVRDVWDLIEDRLDALLQLFDYQDSRREFLTLLSRIHDSSHPSHKYLANSSSSGGDRGTGTRYAELSPIHEHGRSSEMGGSPSQAEKHRRDDGHALLPGRAGQERLHFAADINRRLKELRPAAGAGDGRAGKGEDNGPHENVMQYDGAMEGGGGGDLFSP